MCTCRPGKLGMLADWQDRMQVCWGVCRRWKEGQVLASGDSFPWPARWYVWNLLKISLKGKFELF